jgi:hypothetical protein
MSSVTRLLGGVYVQLIFQVVLLGFVGPRKFYLVRSRHREQPICTFEEDAVPSTKALSVPMKRVRSVLDVGTYMTRAIASLRLTPYAGPHVSRYSGRSG